MKVVVGSTNPTKINAAKMAFARVFPQETVEVIGVSVSSGIPSQPIGFYQTIQGSLNRAKAALNYVPDADFGVGEEGGMQEMPELPTDSLGKVQIPWLETGWCVVVDPEGKVGIGSSIHMQVPPKLLKHIHEGKELGTATDIEFTIIDSGKKSGFFGLMTNNHIDRTAAYADGIISALTRFLHPDLFEQQQ